MRRRHIVLLLHDVAINVINEDSDKATEFSCRTAVRTKSYGVDERPLVVLVQQESFMRLWMERGLGEWFRVCAFSTSEDALAFVRSASNCDVLITDLDLGMSALGGCNIARDVQSRFPDALIFVFSNSSYSDHRLLILRGMRSVALVTKSFGGFFMVSKVRAALMERDRKRG